MTAGRDGYARKYLHDLSMEATCRWCRHPVKAVYRAGLCRHCYDIRGDINRLRKLIDNCKQSGGVPLELDFKLRVAVKMEKDAQLEGRMYDQPHATDIDGRRLVDEFSYISRQLVRSDVYRFKDHIFDQGFTPDQRRLLFYLLSLMSRAQLRRTRSFRAMNSDLHDPE